MYNNTCDKRDRIFQYEGIASFASLPSKVYALRKFIQESVSPSIRNVSRASERVHAWSTAPTQPGRRHAWVTCLRTVFRSRCECERVRASERASASSALNEFSSSPRARLVRRLHTCVCTRVACVRALLRVARANGLRWWRTVNAERAIIRRYFVIAWITFYWRDLHSIISDAYFLFDISARVIAGVDIKRWNAGAENTHLRKPYNRKSNDTRREYAGNLFRARLG